MKLIFHFLNNIYRYEGEFHEEKRHGRGTHYHLCGSKYEGQFKDDLPHVNNHMKQRF